jgi:hypothetical protein
MDERGRAGEGRPVPNRAESAGEAARRLVLKRQKDELRRERDQVLLNLEKDLGGTRMAELFGLEQRSLGRLLQGARERQRAREPGLDSAGASEIAVHRLASRRRLRLVTGSPHPRQAPRQRPDRRTAAGGSEPVRPGPPRIVERPERRSTPEGGRWAQVDSYYEALGRASRIG